MGGQNVLHYPAAPKVKRENGFKTLMTTVVSGRAITTASGRSCTCCAEMMVNASTLGDGVTVLFLLFRFENFSMFLRVQEIRFGIGNTSEQFEYS